MTDLDRLIRQHQLALNALQARRILELEQEIKRLQEQIVRLQVVKARANDSGKAQA